MSPAPASLTTYDPLTALAAGLASLALLAWLFWPRRGLLAVWKRFRRASARVLKEDALKHLCKVEISGGSVSLTSLAGALQSSQNTAAAVIAELQDAGLIEAREGALRLTAEGRRYGLGIIRAHRIWERHLAEQTGVAEADWHELAEREEHRLSADQTEALAASLGHPTHDPHGDPIPTPDGEFVPHGGQPLGTFPVGQRVRVVHIEDEPESLYEQIVAEGIYPGQVIELTGMTNHSVGFLADGRPRQLTPVVAANISADVLARDAAIGAPPGPALPTLPPGEEGVVQLISPLCRGAERRRLLDLGVLPGTRIRAEMRSPGGDPTAYRVRDSLIALRRDQARHVHLRPAGTTA